MKMPVFWNSSNKRNSSNSSRTSDTGIRRVKNAEEPEDCDGTHDGNGGRDIRAAASAEADKRRGKSATYTQPLRGDTPAQEQDIQSFLTQFYGRLIFDYAASYDMQRLLHRHPDTMAVHYALLVPETCSFDQFWARYYYRCSVTTVLQEWRQQECAVRDLRRSVACHQLVPTPVRLPNSIAVAATTTTASAGATAMNQPRDGASSNVGLWRSGSNTPSGKDSGRGNITSSAVNGITSPVGAGAAGRDHGRPRDDRERAAARAHLFQAEAAGDIVETTTAEDLWSTGRRVRHAGIDDDNNNNTEGGDDDNDEGMAIGIGFAASG